MNTPQPSLRQLRAWLQLRELRLRALHAKLEMARQACDQALLACQHKQDERARLQAQRRAARAWCSGPGSGIGPAALALTVAHDKLLGDREERAESAWLDLERQRRQVEQALVQARAQWVQALRQQQAARRWLADWQVRYAAELADAAEAEAEDTRLAHLPWSLAADDSAGPGWPA